MVALNPLSANLSGVVAAQLEQPRYWQTVRRRLFKDKATLAGLFVIAVMFAAICLAPLLAPHDPYQTSMARRLQEVGAPGFPLGTDELGRDMLSRLIYGGRLSWFLGISPVLIAFVVGSSLGVLAGFAGGWVNTLIMRTTDVFYAFPSVLLAVAVSGALGPGLQNAILSLALVFTPAMIRVSESAAAGVRNLDYVEAARATGASPLAIIRVYILPNVIGPIFVYATGLISVSMIMAAGLSFLGLGTRPPEAEWGLMLNTLRTAIYSTPMVAMLPGLCIFVTSLCFNMVSDGLRSAMEIRD
jgi:peptide/nickel transport system permease protein